MKREYTKAAKYTVPRKNLILPFVILFSKRFTVLSSANPIAEWIFCADTKEFGLEL